MEYLVMGLVALLLIALFAFLAQKDLIDEYKKTLKSDSEFRARSLKLHDDQQETNELLVRERDEAYKRIEQLHDALKVFRDQITNLCNLIQDERDKAKHIWYLPIEDQIVLSEASSVEELDLPEDVDPDTFVYVRKFVG